MRKFNLIKVAVLLLFIYSNSWLSVKAQAITSAEIDSLVEKTMLTFEVPGIAVAIVKDGAVIHSKGYGVRSLNSVSGFRTKFDYDNLLYIVAGEIIARVSGKSWEEFVEERIMKPLEMDNSAGNFNRLTDHSNIADAHAPVNYS